MTVRCGSKQQGLQPVSVETNKLLVRRYIEQVANGHDLTAVDQLFAVDFVKHDLEQEDIVGREQMRRFVTDALTAFPDWRFTIEDMIGEADRVVVRLTGHATHQGSLWGLTATDRRISVSEIHIYRVAHNQIVERWDAVDRLGLRRQLEGDSSSAPQGANL